ncbi:MAG: hypothetical protein H0U85_02605, partial [Gemmatimonadales bacterium]|nr:hypothetical protein [Gemmatimonadales bacterium]
MNRFVLVPWLLVGGAVTLNGQQAPASPAEPGRRPMQDNSFLVEEAYNQEPGVVQHISTLQRSAGQWQFGFAQEWPLGGLRNQLSYDVPVSHDGGGTGIGDIALNYRRQLVGTADTRLAIAPRVTALLPTGNSKEGRGAGG